MNEREILAERLRGKIEELGRIPRDVSIAASGKPDLVRDIYRMRRMPTAPVMQELARELSTTTDWLLGRADSPEQPRSDVSFHDVNRDWRGSNLKGIPLLGTAYCDDLAVEGEDGGPLSIERVQLELDHTIRIIERPPALWNAKDAYAIYFHGSSMEPRFEQGDIGVADPRRPPAPRDYVVVQLNEGQGGSDVVTVLVKRLVRATSAYVELEQFNPPLIFRVPRKQVVRMHRILSLGELLGA